MATFNMTHYYGGPTLGLRICPFDPNHRVKDSKYMKHVLKCEQQHPMGRKNLGLSSCARESYLSIDSGISMSKTESTDTSNLIESMNGLSTSDDWFLTDTNQSKTEVFDNHSVCQENESIDCPKTLSSHAINGDNEEMAKTDCNDNKVMAKEQNEWSVPSDAGAVKVLSEELDRSDGNKLIPKEMVETAKTDDKVSHQKNGVKGNGDFDNWETNEKTFKLIDDNLDMTDEQIEEMAVSFVDPFVLSQMDKNERKSFYQKLLEFQECENKRKLKALNELAALQDKCDPFLVDIPSEIRKPHTDIRQLFNLKNKRLNCKLQKTYEVETKPSPEETSEVLDPMSLKLEVCEPLPSHMGHSEDMVSNGQLCLDTHCNSCNHSMTLTEENIKRMTVFCGDCSATKFGGYFECHSCGLYGYFANSQIIEHLNIHFPQLLA